MSVPQRRGLLTADPEQPHPDLAPDSSVERLQAASVAYRIAIGLLAGTVCGACQPPAPIVASVAR